MVIKHKIWIAIGLGVILTTLYYYIYAFFQIWFDNLCEHYYCIEFFPIGDFIACYIAIVGLYFVVTSLDAWKHQDKYNNAKNRIIILNDIQQNLNIDFNFKICAFYTIKQKPSEKKILRYGNERDYIVDSFKAYLDDTKILEDIRNLDRQNHNIKNCLYQNEFDDVIQHAYAYIQGCCKEIKTLKITDDDSQDSYQDELTIIFKKYRNEFVYFQSKLQVLNYKLNKFIE